MKHVKINKMSQDTAMACSITAGQTAADAHEQGQQSSPLQQKALTTVPLSAALQQEWVPNKGCDFK